MDPDRERARLAAAVSASTGLQSSGTVFAPQSSYGQLISDTIASSVLHNASSQMQQHQPLLNVSSRLQQPFTGAPMSFAQLEQQNRRQSYSGGDFAPGLVPPASGRSYFPPHPTGFVTSQHLQSQSMAMHMTSASQTFSPPLTSAPQFSVPMAVPSTSSLQLVSHLVPPGMPQQQMELEAQQHQIQQHQLQQQMQQHQVRSLFCWVCWED